MSKSFPVAGVYMIVCLALCCAASLATFAIRKEKLAIENVSFLPLVTGQTSAEFEKKYEEHLLIRDQTVGIWKAIEYGIFKSGGKKTLVGKDGWLYTAEEFDRQPEAQEAEQRLFNLVGSVNTYLESKGIKLAVVLVPAKARIYPEYLSSRRLPAGRDAVYDRAYAHMTQMGIPAPNLVEAYQKEKGNVPLYFKLDTHWTPAGAEIAANLLAESLGGYLTEGTEYTKSVQPSEELEGDLEKYIGTWIFSPLFAPEKDSIERHDIQKVDDGSGGGLFGDEVIPVVLVGTSYSAIDKWNFEGELKSALKADVLNLADEGQGPLEPMAKFLSDTNLDNSDIKLVVWEIPERFIPVSYDDVQFPEFIEGAR